jgi:hypothetical protein
MDARSILGVSAMRTTFLVDVSAAQSREGQTGGNGARVVTIGDNSSPLGVSLDVFVDDDLDPDEEDDEDFDEDDEDSDEDENDEDDDEETETWQVSCWTRFR